MLRREGMEMQSCSAMFKKALYNAPEICHDYLQKKAVPWAVSLMKFSIQMKLASGFGVCVALMMGLVTCNISELRKLESLYGETFHRSADMEMATDAQHIGGDLYQVIADAVINRDLALTERDWNLAKAQNRKKLLLVAAASDTIEERREIAQAEAAFDDIIRIFESEMLPLVRAGSAVPGPISEVDARIDSKIAVIERSLKSVARCMSADNAHASREFHAVLADSIKLGLGFSLFGVLAALAISALTTRWIVRPLREITRAAREMAQGNYDAQLKYHSGDEAGVLAHAFRTMAAQVAKRSEELQAANQLLSFEVRDRRLSEAEVSRLNSELEGRVAERTGELLRANDRLEAVILMQKRAEHELQQSRSELRDLTQHLQGVLEAERSDLAREIHDDLGQMLTALKMDLAWIGKKLPEEQRHLLSKTLEVSRHIDQTISTVQRISAQLRPGILDDLGLSAALEWQAGEFQKKTGVECRMLCDFDCACLSQRSSTALFRIFQESLTNIYRHAAATRAQVTLAGSAGTLVLSVTDNGCGVTEENIADHRSLGFIGMRERVRSLGGQLTISRLPEGGTCVQVTVPLDAAKEALPDANADHISSGERGNGADQNTDS
jgi:signal transduction histidine kinase